MRLRVDMKTRIVQSWGMNYALWREFGLFILLLVGMWRALTHVLTDVKCIVES